MTTHDPAQPLATPLRLPAILQNPTNKTQRQVDAYVSQQREKVQAKRDAAKRTDEPIVGSKRGKRVVRRMNNAALLDNPHAVAPKRADLTPAVPLHYHPLRPSFPADALARSEPVAGVAGSRADPFAPSSHAGAFSTSLKGTRQLLRRRGRRAEVLVPIVEKEVRAWLAGEYALGEDEGKELAWRVVDATEVDAEAGGAGDAESGNATAGPSRRMPAQHQVRASLPPLPITSAAATLPAVLELNRSPAHLTWSVPDSFDRLVLHLVARYYELVSWSEDATTTTGARVRLTHLVRPALVKPKPAAVHGLSLLTPDTSDVSGHSASDASASSDSDATIGGGGEDVLVSDTDSEAGDRTFRSLTERFAQLGDEHTDDDEDEEEDAAANSASLAARFALDVDHDDAATPHHPNALRRTHSATSSAYASDEGSEAGFQGMDGSVFTLNDDDPALPLVGPGGLPSVGDAPAPRRLGEGDWSDKPTFFEWVFS